MAVERPWITPQDVKDYTEQKDVQGRSDEKLKFDVMRAEQRVIKITNNRFDGEEYQELPEPVKMATILLAEAYAKNAVESSRRRIRSETYDEYSYTVESGIIDVDNLNLDELLGEYVLESGIGKVVMKLRSL